MLWYRHLVEWGDDQDYNSPEGTTGHLRLFFDTLREEFPAMNGPYAFDIDAIPMVAPEQKAPSFWRKLLFRDEPAQVAEPAFDEDLVTDYCIADNAIYMAFAWSVADKAYNRVVNTALSTGVGFFNVSADNGEILHDPEQFEALMGL